MIRFAVLLSFFFAVFAGAQAKDPAKMDSEDFLDECRKQLLAYSWVKLKGNINHKDPDGKRSRPMKVVFAAQLIPNKITFKATVNGDQSLKAEHIFGQKHDTKVLENTLQPGNGFDLVGIKPTDLSLAFMYWDYLKELPPQRMKFGALKCRVFLLGNPDGKDFVKVFLSEKYLGPFEVHWLKGIKPEDQDNPVQTLEFKDVAEKNKVWVPLESKISNAKGELQIKFKDVDAAFAKKVPEDLYKTED